MKINFKSLILYIIFLCLFVNPDFAIETSELSNQFEKDLNWQFVSFLCTKLLDKPPPVKNGDFDLLNSEALSALEENNPELKGKPILGFKLNRITSTRVIIYDAYSLEKRESIKKIQQCEPQHYFLSIKKISNASCPELDIPDKQTNKFHSALKPSLNSVEQNLNIECNNKYILQNDECVNPCLNNKSKPNPDPWYDHETGKKKITCRACPPGTEFDPEIIDCLDPNGCKAQYHLSTSESGERACCPSGFKFVGKGKCKPDSDHICDNCIHLYEDFKSWQIKMSWLMLPLEDYYSNSIEIKKINDCMKTATEFFKFLKNQEEDSLMGLRAVCQNSISFYEDWNISDDHTNYHSENICSRNESKIGQISQYFDKFYLINPECKKYLKSHAFSNGSFSR